MYSYLDMVGRRVVLVVQNVRSAHNVGSLLRTADGLGIEKVYFCGFTPYPETKIDKRLPHVAKRAGQQIKKTSLGAEASVTWQHRESVFDLLSELKSEKFITAALEQSSASIMLPKYTPAGDIALIVGSEASGLDQKVLDAVDVSLEIPMLGAKESFNVAVAAGMALYHLRFSG